MSGGDLASRIRPHMPVVGDDGHHVGTVDGVEGDRLKLTRTDVAAGGEHHYLSLSVVREISDGHVRLNLPAGEAHRIWAGDREDGMSASGASSAGAGSLGATGGLAGGVTSPAAGAGAVGTHQGGAGPGMGGGGGMGTAAGNQGGLGADGGAGALGRADRAVPGHPGAGGGVRAGSGGTAGGQIGADDDAGASTGNRGTEGPSPGTGR